MVRAVWPVTRPRDYAGMPVAGHRHAITVARFGPDGGLVTGDESGLVLVSDPRTGATRHSSRLSPTPRRYGPAVTAVATGPGERLAVALADGAVRVVEFRPDGQAVELRTLAAGEHGGALDGLAFLADGNRLLTRHGNRFRVHDLGGDTTLLDVAPDDGVRSGWPWLVLDDHLVVGDGEVVATWPLDGTGGRHELRGHAASVTALDTLPGLLVSTDEIGVVRTWDAAGGRCLAAFVGAGVPAVDGRSGRLVIPAAPDVARIVDPRSGDPRGEVARHTRRALRRERTSDAITALAGRLRGRGDRLYDRADAVAARIGELGCRAGPGLTWTVIHRSDEEVSGDLLLSRHVLAFLGPDGRAVEEVRVPGRCIAILALPQPDRLATVNDSGVVRVWTTGGASVSSLDVTDADVTAVATDSTGARIVVGDRAGGVRIVDPSAPAPPDDTNDFRHEVVVDLVVDRAGAWAATAGDDRSVLIWDLDGAGTPRHRFPGHVTGVFRSRIRAIRVVAGSDADGPWVAYTDDDGMLRVRDPRGGGRISLVAGGGGELAGVAGPGWVAVAEPDGRVLLRHPRTGDVRAALLGHRREVRDAAVDRRATLLVTTDTDDVRLWDVGEGVDTGTARLVLPAETRPGDRVHVRVDEDGSWFAVAGRRRHTAVDARVRVYEPDGTVMVDLALPSPVSVTAAGPGGTLLLGRDDGALMAGRPGISDLVTTAGHGTAALTACAASPDGRFAATGDERGVARIWDLRTMEPGAEIDTGGPVTCCVWASDRRMVIGGRTGLNLLTVE